MICPCCGKRVPRSHFACESGAKGGKAGTGAAKARTSEQARAAVKARWSARAAGAGVGDKARGTKKGKKPNAKLADESRREGAPDAR